MRIGVFGGTFDPPHVAHLVAAQEVLERLRLGRVLFVPAALPPHKEGVSITPAPLRLAMLRAAVAEDERFRVCELELERDGPSYTVDTLRELRERRSGDELVLIIGTDQLRELATWREPGEIARLARIAVVSRWGVDPAGVEAGVDVAWEEVAIPRLDVSASDIRCRVAEGRPVRYLVPDAVLEVIEREGLYR